MILNKRNDIKLNKKTMQKLETLSDIFKFLVIRADEVDINNLFIHKLNSLISNDTKILFVDGYCIKLKINDSIPVNFDILANCLY